MRNATRVYVTVLAAMLVSATATAAQEAPRAAAARPCGEQPARGDLGYGALSCSNCTHYVDREDPTHDRWEFRSEPVVERVRPGGAADGKLRSGDTIIAIDGHRATRRPGAGSDYSAGDRVSRPGSAGGRRPADAAAAGACPTRHPGRCRAARPRPDPTRRPHHRRCDADRLDGPQHQLLELRYPRLRRLRARVAVRRAADRRIGGTRESGPRRRHPRRRSTDTHRWTRHDERGRRAPLRGAAPGSTRSATG
jgi:hypothetical protein